MQALVPSIKIKGPDKITDEGLYTLEVKNFPVNNVVISWDAQRDADDVEEVETRQWYNPDAKLIVGEKGRSVITCSVDYYYFDNNRGDYVLLGTKKARKVVEAKITNDFKDYDPTGPANTSRRTNSSLLFNQKQIKKLFNKQKGAIRKVVRAKGGYRSRRDADRAADSFWKLVKKELPRQTKTWNKFCQLGNTQKANLPSNYKGMTALRFDFFWENSGTIAYCGSPYAKRVSDYRVWVNGSFYMGFNLYQWIARGNSRLGKAVILHELGHATGLVLPARVTQNPPACIVAQYNKFSCQSNARLTSSIRTNSRYVEGRGIPTNVVALENRGGSGTAGSHWSGAYRNGKVGGALWSFVGYDNELMGGYAKDNMKMTELTLSYMIDIGYRIKKKKPQKGLVLLGKNRSRVGAKHSSATRHLGQVAPYTALKGLPTLKSDLPDGYDKETLKQARILSFLSGHKTNFK